MSQSTSQGPTDPTIDAVTITARIKTLLPIGWFGAATPVLDAVAGGIAALWANVYQLIHEVRAMTRIATASGVFLDLAARDFFGDTLARRPGESDPVFSARIRANLLVPRATRQALITAIERATGRTPKIFEPFNPVDTGGYSTNTLGYGVLGGYGSLTLPYQVFVTAYRSDAMPASYLGGYNFGPGGYSTAPMAWLDPADNPGLITDDEIYGAITAVLPVNAIAWTRLSD